MTRSQEICERITADEALKSPECSRKTRENEMKNLLTVALIALALFAAINLKACSKPSAPPGSTTYLPQR